MNVPALRGCALSLAVAAAVVVPASTGSATPVPTVRSAPAENPYCDPRSGYGCEGYGYEYGYYPRDDEGYYRHRHHHHRHHHHRPWWY